MKIAFFGIHYACNYFHIGGTDSFVRRIAIELVRNHSDTVDYVLYGSPAKDDVQIMPRLRIRYFTTLDEALSALSSYEHVIAIYLPPRDRVRFTYFRVRCHYPIRFHVVYFSWPDSRVKRELMFTDSRLAPFNGRVFTISPRQYRSVQRWCASPVLLWPPVPEEYFVTPDSKPKSSRLRITWIGRIDPGKGIQEAVDLFRELVSDPTIELTMCGHRWTTCVETSELHRWLLEQKEFPYIDTEYAEHSPEVEQAVGEMLQHSDMLVLPYRKLSSTIDMPLLLLEAMAALCAVAHKPMGDIATVYGNSHFLLSKEEDFVKGAYDLIEHISPSIANEQRRLFEHNRKLSFDVATVTKRFRCALQDDPISPIQL